MSAFEPNEIDELMSIPGQISKDSTFVNSALKMQYSNCIDKLRNRSVKGTGYNVRRCKDAVKRFRAKPALTPEKVSAIRLYYNERIQKYSTDSTDFSKRYSDIYFNKLLSSGIFNIGKNVVNSDKKKSVGNLLD